MADYGDYYDSQDDHYSGASDFNLDENAHLYGEDDESLPASHRVHSTLLSPRKQHDAVRPTKARNDKATSSSKYHNAVFPGMKIPIHMRRHRKVKAREQDKGVVHESIDTKLPIMSIQCPLPGGTVSTQTTDPVEKVSWGPITRLEASGEARDLVKKWIKAKHQEKAAKDGSPETEPFVEKEKAAVPDVELGDHTIQAGNENGFEDGAGTPAMSQAETDTTSTSARVLMPPPPTPPDAIFHHVLSMPTLPGLHSTSDPGLVEQYCHQHAADPKAFERETRAIKQRLIEAKVARGGIDRLLANEYTVELASREDAVVVAKKWVRGRIGRERSGTNTSTNSLPVSIDEVKIRGGDVEPNTLAVGQNAEKAEGLGITGIHYPEQSSSVHQTGPQVESDTTQQPAFKDGHSKPTTTGHSRRELKARLKALDLGSHVSKVTTYGSVRHQHSVEREANEFGEKRTVTTWIEITEVYQVPSTKGLTLKDVVAAVEAESSAEEGTSDEDAARSKKQKKNKGKKHVTKDKAKGRRAKQTKRVKEGASSDSDAGDEGHASDSDDDAGSDADGSFGQEFHDPDESSTESLLRTLSRFGEVNAATINKMSDDLRGIIACLRGNGLLATELEDE